MEFTENLLLLVAYVGILSGVFAIGAFLADYVFPKLLKRG